MDQHISSHPSGLPTREEAEKMKEQNPSKGNLPEKDKMYREMFFPTSIYFWDHPEPTKTNNQIKKNVDHWYKRDQEGIIRSNSLGWHSAVDMHHRNEYNHITKWIFDKAQQVFTDHGYDPDSEPVCDNMWAIEIIYIPVLYGQVYIIYKHLRKVVEYGLQILEVKHI